MRHILISLLLVGLITAGILPAITQQEIALGQEPSPTSQLVSANNQCAFDLYAALRSEDDNLIFSPYSISLALALVYAGAEGDTAAQMADTLHFDMPRDQLNAAFFDLQSAFNTDIEAPEWATPSELDIVNGIWGQRNYPIRSEYLDLLQTQYEAGFASVDFANDPEAARELINSWISENSNERIPEMLAPGSISPMTRTILANVIFFRGTWQMKFPEAGTTDGPFTLLDGSVVTVPMMHQALNSHGYHAGENYQAVELHFQDSAVDGKTFDMAMLFILPDEGALEEVEKMLDVAWFDQTLVDLSYVLMNLALPKFGYETNVNLSSILNDMGMPDAFDPALADFSGIVDDPGEPFYIDFVLHRANIDVDEIGTEAAAATVLGMGGGGSPEDPIDVTFDRPFIYAIYDRMSGSILFMGRVLNPEP